MKTVWIVCISTSLLLTTSIKCLGNESLAKESGCFECHSLDDSGIGPSYRAIVTKYQGNSNTRPELIKVVKKGGKGNWTDISRGVPMPPYSPRLTDAEIEQLIDWILTL